MKFPVLRLLPLDPGTRIHLDCEAVQTSHPEVSSNGSLLRELLEHRIRHRSDNLDTSYIYSSGPGCELCTYFSHLIHSP